MVKICLVNAATHRIAVQLDHRADRHPARIQSALNQRVVSSLLRQTGGRLFALSFLPLIRISSLVIVRFRLPTPKDDSDPLVSQRTHRRLMTFAPRLL